MRITDVRVHQYSIPLTGPLTLRGQTYLTRDGLLVQLCSDGGIEGWGEIAPLAGISTETFKESLTQILLFKSALRGQDIPKELLQLNGSFSDWLGEMQLNPSVRFGVEMAILNLMAALAQKPLFQLISKNDTSVLRINGLLTGSTQDVCRQATAMLAEGFTGFKLKVGKKMEDDIKKVLAVNEIINGKALLHLDANQQWTLSEAVTFGHEVGLAAADYIEEPLKDIKDIPQFFAQTTIPVALDETLMTHGIDEIKSIEGVDLLVLKPQLLGGIEKTYMLSLEAKRLGISSVISSSFESGVGITTLGNLAIALSNHMNAGLDTLKWFSQDLLKEPISFGHGKYDVLKRPLTSKDLMLDLLKEVN